MKKSNMIGAVIMTAVILFSIPLGVGRSFTRLRENVEREYYYDNTGYAVWQGIDSREGTARNILTLAERYADRDPDVSSLMGDLDYAVKLADGYWFTDIQDIDKTVEYNETLGEAARVLCDKLETLDLSEKDAKYPRQLMADMDSEQDKLQRSSFNEEASKYNEKLHKSVFRPIARMMGVKYIATFDQSDTAAVTTQ